MVRLCSLSSPKNKEWNSGNQSPCVCEHPLFASETVSPPNVSWPFPPVIMGWGRGSSLYHLLWQACFLNPLCLWHSHASEHGNHALWEGVGVGNHGMKLPSLIPSLSSRSSPTYYPLISPSGRGDQPLSPRSLMGFLNQANHKTYQLYQILHIHMMSF